MTPRRNIRDVQVNRRYGALCARERLRIRRLLQLVMNFAQLAESDALGEVRWLNAESDTKRR